MSDVVVVGVGGVGSATAAVLARRGHRVVGLEQHRPVHDQGASHGETRIVRKAYFEGDGYVPMLLRAFELWDELGLLDRTGGLFLGAPESRVLAGSLATARVHGLAHERAYTRSGRSRRVGRSGPASSPGAQRPGARTSEAAAWPPWDVLTRTPVEVADQPSTRSPKRRSAPAPAARWSCAPTVASGDTTPASGSNSATVPVGGVIAGKRRVTSAGSSSVMHWFDPPAGAASFAPDRFPVWIWQRPDGTAAYGVPGVAGPGGGVKAALHHSPVRPPADWTPAQVGALLAPLLPGLGSRVLRSVDCTYTMTPDEDFVLGHHPASDRVVLACGFSGHGFTLTPVLGEVLADLAVDGATAYDLRLLDPRRLAA